MNPAAAPLLKAHRLSLPSSASLEGVFSSETCFDNGEKNMAFPIGQAAINALLQIWLVKIDPWSALYGLSTDITKQVKTDAVIYAHLIASGNLLEDDVDEFFAYKKNMMGGNPLETAATYPTITLTPLPGTEGTPKPGIEARNKELYNFFKRHPNRTEESLADLGISDSAPAAISPDDLKPTLKSKALPDDKIEHAFNKQGQKAARIQMRRGGSDWTTSGDPTNSPFIDNTASTGGNPEKREYRAIYLKDNKPFGQYSDIVTVFTTP